VLSDHTEALAAWMRSRPHASDEARRLSPPRSAGTIAEARGQGDTGNMIDRTPGRGRYAATEREKRWLLRRLPDGVTNPVEIFDKYLAASTLRLRRAQSASTVVYKLGQKVRHDPTDPSINQVTNMYLSQSEFELLGQARGAVLSKTRWHWTVGESVLSVDQYGESLRGLVMAEIELPMDGVGPK